MNPEGPPSHVVLEKQEGKLAEWILFPWGTQPGLQLNLVNSLREQEPWAI